MFLFVKQHKLITVESGNTARVSTQNTLNFKLQSTCTTINLVLKTNIYYRYLNINKVPSQSREQIIGNHINVNRTTCVTQNVNLFHLQQLLSVMFRFAHIARGKKHFFTNHMPSLVNNLMYYELLIERKTIMVRAKTN